MASRKKITQDHWKLILKRIKGGLCVPFLGAGVNVSRDNPPYEGLRLGGQVAWELKKQIRFTGHDPYNLPRVALEYEVRTDRGILLDSLKEILNDTQCKPSPLLNTLAGLPFKLIVSTNYDRLMEQALQGRRKYEPIAQPVEGYASTPETVEWFTYLERFAIDGGLLLYKIHGTFKDQSDSPLTVTEDDYIQYLTVAGVENIGLPRVVSKHLTTSTLLFLGYSLEDWDFRAVYKGLIKNLNRYTNLNASYLRQSLAIQKDPPPYLIRYWQRQSVEIYNVDVYDFAGELEERYVKEYGSVPYPPPPAPPEEG